MCFVYFFCRECIEQMIESKFIIQNMNDGAIFIDDANYVDIPSNQVKGFTPFFENKNFSYYEKVELLGEDYYFITQISRQDIIKEVISSLIIPLGVSLFILAILFVLSYIKVIQVIKKPFEKFLYEVECLEDKDLSYLSSINESQADYVEFSRIIKDFKKICVYNKNNYENIIQSIKNELVKAQEGNKSKTIFLANMSHEMRTPLNSIIGYTQLTKKIGFVNQKKVEEYFNSIQNSSEILLQKVNDILDLSKIESNQFELHEKPTQLTQIIKEIYNLLTIQAEKKNIEFTYYVDPQIPKYLDIDSTRLKQVIINLCSNAIKFTDEGNVKLQVEVFGYTSDAVILEYTIIDTGIGIPKEQMDNIFIPFVQIDNQNNLQIGTGLGLTIARDLIRLMGGDINVTSKENIGSIFSFITKFRISTQKMEETENIEEITHELFAEKIQDKRILVCEDNLINQIFMKEIFSVFNKKDIDIASDGIEAVDMCKDKKYDLIIMDIQMPKLSGIEATKIIRSLVSYQDIPIIALTANVFSDQINEYLMIGMNDYLPKPVDIKQFKIVLVKYI